jgi:hypothetical protein
VARIHWQAQSAWAATANPNAKGDELAAQRSHVEPAATQCVYVAAYPRLPVAALKAASYMGNQNWLSASREQTAPPGGRVTCSGMTARDQKDPVQVERVEQSARPLDAHSRPTRNIAQWRRLTLQPQNR